MEVKSERSIVIAKTFSCKPCSEWRVILLLVETNSTVHLLNDGMKVWLLSRSNTALRLTGAMHGLTHVQRQNSCRAWSIRLKCRMTMESFQWWSWSIQPVSKSWLEKNRQEIETIACEHTRHHEIKKRSKPPSRFDKNHTLHLHFLWSNVCVTPLKLPNFLYYC